MLGTLLGSFLLAPSVWAAPDAYGSKDGKIKAKTPLERRAGPAERAALARDESKAVDLRIPVLIGNLPQVDLERLPEGVDLGTLIDIVLASSQKLRPVYVVDCVEAECLRQRANTELSNHLRDLAATEGGVSKDGSIVAVSAEAKARDRLAVISMSLDKERRLTLILAETPGRGLLGQIVSDPLEAKDIFETAFRDGLTRLLRLGLEDEGQLVPIEAPDTLAVQGEPAHVLAFRQDLKAKSKYGLYGGAGVAGLGLALGLYATVNAYRWRRLSYRESEYREQFRSAVAGQAVLADVLILGGGAVAGAAYWARGHAENVGAFAWLAGNGPTKTASVETEAMGTEPARQPRAGEVEPVSVDPPEASQPKRKLMR
ncbi:MAG TPA: hypothetical protein DEB46_11420 [Myxococcales bacterium]|nr:hypothetical protein [Myxococcales bacterium]